MLKVFNNNWSETETWHIEANISYFCLTLLKEILKIKQFHLKIV